VTTRLLLVASVCVLVVAGLIAALELSSAQELPEVGDRQVVAAVAAESVTEYEPDPFQPDRLRSSTVRVRTVALVYQDGSLELKPCQ
jgi:negative regulator of sigma E activity